MQSYDILMLLVLIAAALWGYWKGFVWQLASLLSIFSSYFLAFALRVQVARLIDADPPWNMFAAMLIVYCLSSLVIWVGTGFASSVLESLKLKDFDRQLGATFGLAKGAIFCLLITFFAVSLLGPREQERICSSRSGYYIARVLRSSGGLIPQELAAVVDPYVSSFRQKLDEYQPAETPAAEQPAFEPPSYADWQPPPTHLVPAQPGAPQGGGWEGYYQPPAPTPNQGNPWYGTGYAPQYPPTQYAPYQQPYDPRYDPRYQDPRYYDPRYADPRYDQGYYSDPRGWPPAPQPQPAYGAPRYADPSAAPGSSGPWR